MNWLTQRARPSLLAWLDVMGSYTVSDSKMEGQLWVEPGKIAGNPASLQVAGVKNPWFMVEPAGFLG